MVVPNTRRIPEATVARLPVYQRILLELVRAGTTTVSSDQLADMARVNASKVRKDLSFLGSFGTRGSGYEAQFLLSQIDRELGLHGDFVLQVGRIEPRKNPAAALAAVEKLDGVTFAVAGSERDPALAAQLRRSPSCRVLGRVDQPTLELLYKRARAIVVPSLYEGFGLPVLEAMARGQVVVAAATSSLPEVGGDAVLYVKDAGDPHELTSALRTALYDKTVRARLTRLAKKRAATFTWDRFTAGVVAVIRELVG